MGNTRLHIYSLLIFLFFIFNLSEVINMGKMKDLWIEKLNEEDEEESSDEEFDPENFRIRWEERD